MKRTARYLIRFVLAGNVALCSFAQSFGSYPGAREDEQASRAASAAASGAECKVFYSGDDFQKVYAFYKARYREFNAPFPVQKLPDGHEVKWAFFILDGAPDLTRSRFWMKIQRPAIEEVNEAGDFRKIRDVSVIQTVRRP